MIAKKINGFIGITRLDKPIGIYLLLWPALIALLISTEASINYSFVIIIVAGSILVRSTGCVINDIFDIEFDKKCKTLVEYTVGIDEKCLHKYFAYHWEADMKKWKHSGLQLIDQVNDLNPRAVLDVGCGGNEFKNKIHNLIGLDPYNHNADYQIDLLEFRPMEKFDVILGIYHQDYERNPSDPIRLRLEICKTVEFPEK